MNDSVHEATEGEGHLVRAVAVPHRVARLDGAGDWPGSSAWRIDVAVSIARTLIGRGSHGCPRYPVAVDGMRPRPTSRRHSGGTGRRSPTLRESRESSGCAPGHGARLRLATRGATCLMSQPPAWPTLVLSGLPSLSAMNRAARGRRPGRRRASIPMRRGSTRGPRSRGCRRHPGRRGSRRSRPWRCRTSEPLRPGSP